MPLLIIKLLGQARSKAPVEFRLGNFLNNQDGVFRDADSLDISVEMTRQIIRKIARKLFSFPDLNPARNGQRLYLEHAEIIPCPC